MQQEKDALKKVQRRRAAWRQAYKANEERLEELGLKYAAGTQNHITAEDNVQSENCWRLAAGGTVHTGQATDLLKVVKPWARLEVTSNFFAVRTADEWNINGEDSGTFYTAL
jgi:hypothetical protein